MRRIYGWWSTGHEEKARTMKSRHLAAAGTVAVGLLTSYGCSNNGTSKTGWLASADTTSSDCSLQPGDGNSFVDGSGNTWTLAGDGEVEENGSPAAGGGGTSAMAYSAGTDTVWGQDSGSGNWFSWNGGGWWDGPQSAPAASGAPSCGNGGGSSGGGSTSGSSSGGSSTSGSSSGSGSCTANSCSLTQAELG